MSGLVVGQEMSAYRFCPRFQCTGEGGKGFHQEDFRFPMVSIGFQVS